MSKPNVSSKFYLGANTRDGFFSRFDELREFANYRHQYIIKGCAGSGKSTFMKQILLSAKNRGCQCEEIRCSSDPDSLDGIILHDLGICFVDGTAPHAIEPKYAGVAESYIDFSPYWDESQLLQRRDEIIKIDSQVKKCYKNAYAHLSCGGIYDSLLRGYCDNAQNDSFLRRIDGIISRELPKKCKNCVLGKKYVRYLSGFTPLGYTTFDDTLSNMCDRVIAFSDEFGMCNVAFRKISDAVQSRGIDVYECLSPLYKEAFIEHLIIPSLRLGFVSVRHGENTFSTHKNINLNHYVDVYRDKSQTNRIKLLKKSRKEAIKRGLSELSEAKMWHDKLEEAYKPCMDFDGISQLLKRWLIRLGL